MRCHHEDAILCEANDRMGVRLAVLAVPAPMFLDCSPHAPCRSANRVPLRSSYSWLVALCSPGVPSALATSAASVIPRAIRSAAERCRSA